MADGKVVIDIILDDGTVAKGVANVDKQLGGLANSGRKAAVGIKEIVTSLGLVAAASKAIDMVKNALDGAIDRYDTLNNFPRVLQQMGFDADDSQKAIQRLSDGVKGLPTTLDSVAKNAQRLATMTGDLDGAVETTLALNNAFLASGSSSADAARGLEQYVQMLAVGAVDLAAWRTLQETMGVALNDVAKAFGYTGASAQMDLYDALKDGHITFDEFNAKLIELSNTTGGFAERARTATGGIKTAWANMRTAVVRGVTNIIESIDSVLEKTPLKSIENIISGIGNAFFSVLDGIAKAIPKVINALQPLFKAISVFYNTFMSVWYDTGEVADLLGMLGISPKTAAKVESVLKKVVTAIQNLNTFIRTTIANLKKFWEKNAQKIFQNTVSTFTKIWKSIQPILAVIYSFVVEFLGNKVIPFIKEQLDGLRQFWDENGKQIMEAVKNAFQFILGVIQFVMPAVKFIIEIVWSAIKDIIGGALNVIKGLIQVFTAIFTGDWSQLWEGIKKILMGAVNLILGILSLNFLGSIRTIFTNLLKTGVNIVKNMWTNIVNFFRNFAGNASGIVSNMASRIWGIIKNMATNFVQSILNMRNNVISKIKSIKDGIINTLKNINLVKIGKDIILGLAKGIGSAVSAVTDKVKSIGKTITTGFKKVFKTASPSKVMRDEIGRWIPAGIGVGIEKNQDSALKGMRKLADSLMNDAEVELGVTNRLRGVQAPISNTLPFGMGMVQSIIQTQPAVNPYDDSEVVSLLRQILEKGQDIYMDHVKVGSIVDNEQARRVNLIGRRVALE